MRVKEIEKTANVAWSPAQQHPIYLATGTAAQQLDATFSTSAALEIYALNLAEAGLEMKCAGAIPCDFRFHKLVWGSYGMQDGGCGVLAGGADNGNLLLWKPHAIMAGDDALLTKLDKHTGAVGALDFNPFQDNLLASGASESEIYIWDLNNTSNPMTPGQKSQPPDDVTCVGWNRQVQHIMASTYAGRCVVWDLRKNEPIIKVSDSMSRIKCKLLAWHPDVATQLCLASEDDHNPVIQLWDLRFATSPLKVLENHQRGILSMAWCPQDPDLLVSCGKDNRILCWNPNSQAQMGEVVYELPTSNQWSFDVQWCPRNPAVISSCAFDGHISVYSLMGGTAPPAAPSSKIVDSFGSDPFAAQQMPNQAATEEKKEPVLLKRPPKWLRRPVGASFGFGGKLVTFENMKQANPQQPVQRLVNISQVVTEVDLVSRSNQLEHALANNAHGEFCAMKVANSKDDMEQNIWSFLQVHFESDSRTRFLELLGYNKDEVARKVADDTGADVTSQPTSGVSASELANQMGRLNTSSTEKPPLLTCVLYNTGAPAQALAHAPAPPQQSASKQSVSADGAEAFELIASKSELEQSATPTPSPLQFSVEDDASGLITQALLTANFPAAVEVCLHNNRLAEAVILAMAGGPELVKQTQARVFEKQHDCFSKVISAVVNSKYEEVVKTCDISNWKEALAVSLTYSQPHEFASLCDILGERLEAEGDASLAANACLCYICAGDVEKLVACWNRHVKNSASPAALQDLVEKVMVLRRAIESSTGQELAVESGVLAQKLSQYAEMLAAQGSAATAINYLGRSSEMTLATLRYRLFNALPNSQGVQGPQRPFNVLDIRPEQSAQAAPAQQPSAAPATRQRSNSGYYQAHSSNVQTTTNTTSMYGGGTYAGYSQASSNYPQPGAALYNPATYNTATSTATSSYPGQNYAGYPNTQGAYSYNSNGYGGASTSQPNSTLQPAVFDPTASSASGYTPEMILQGLRGLRRDSEESSQDVEGYRLPFSGSPPYSSAASTPGMPAANSYQDHRPPNAGWNDPPPLKNSKKKAETSPAAPATQPITQPIYGAVPEPAAPGGPTGYNPAGLYNPQEYQRQQPQPVPAAQKAEPAPVKEKGPVPAEHLILQTVLEKLARQCLQQSNNPHIKRKLEDVLRKLETLYDKLREQALSESVTSGLHHIAQAIQAYDYNTALAYHAQMVSQGNFSEISSFMPGVKMLMQTAMQMNVYIPQ